MKQSLLFGLMLVLAVGSACAGSVSVTNYNWLQLPATNVTASIGSDSGEGGSWDIGPDAFRWGGYEAWLPNEELTASATTNYWAILELDESRNITNVWVQFSCYHDATVSNFCIEASNDGTNWSEIGSHDYGSAQSGMPRTEVDVTDGNYKYVRVLLKAGDYTDHSYTNIGGPGLVAIEPMGDGTLDKSQANWANRPTFNTSVTNNGLSSNFNFTNYNDGFLYERDHYSKSLGDTNNWASGHYGQVDLKQNRFIDTAIVVWRGNYYGLTFNVKYSTDGDNFSYVTGLTGPVNYAGQAAMKYTFDRVKARYIRICDATGPGGGYSILHQFLLYGTPPPPAGTTFTIY